MDAEISVAILTDKVGVIEADLKHLHDCVEEVKSISAKNEALLEDLKVVTHEVRDILGTFRVLGAAAKWATAVGAFCVMLYHGWQKVTGR